ncbi:hypothetical protein WN093_02590 [Gammaproteobacteria bacterium AS21]
MDTLTNNALKQAINSAKKAIAVKADTEQGYLYRAILDDSGSIPVNIISQPKAKPLVNETTNIDPDEFLALLLDPQNIDALLEANLATSSNADTLHPTDNNTVLKIEDVLYKDESLDHLLPPADDQWLLYGNSDAINDAILGPAMHDIRDALLMMQLQIDNFVE